MVNGKTTNWPVGFLRSFSPGPVPRKSKRVTAVLKPVRFLKAKEREIMLSGKKGGMKGKGKTAGKRGKGKGEGRGGLDAEGTHCALPATRLLQATPKKAPAPKPNEGRFATQIVPSEWNSAATLMTVGQFKRASGSLAQSCAVAVLSLR